MDEKLFIKKILINFVDSLKAENIELYCRNLPDEKEELIKHKKNNFEVIMEISKKEIAKGDYLCLQGEESDSIFVLEKGDLEVIKVQDEEKVTKEIVEEKGEKIDVINTPNFTIGEIGAILNKPRNVSLCALTDCVVTVIPVEEGLLKKIIELKRDIGLNIIKVLTIRIQRTSKKIYTIEKKIIDICELIKKSVLTFKKILFQASEMEIEINSDELNESIGNLNSQFTSYLEAYSTYLNLKEKKNIKPTRLDYETGEVIIPYGKHDPYFYLLLEGEVIFNIGTKTTFKCSQKYALFGNYFDLFDPKSPDNDKISYFTVFADKSSKIRAVKQADIKKTLEKNVVLVHFGEIAARQLSAINEVYSKSLNDHKKLEESLLNSETGIKSLFQKFKKVIVDNKKEFDDEIIKSFEQIETQFQALKPEDKKVKSL